MTPDPEDNPKPPFRSSMNFDGDDFEELARHMKAMNVTTKSLTNVITTQGTDLNEDDQKMLQEAWDEDGGTPIAWKQGDAGKDIEAVLDAAPLTPWVEDWAWGFIDEARFTRLIFADLSKTAD